MCSARGDILILDDPHDPRNVHSPAERRNVSRWVREAFFNRVNDFRTGRHLIVGARTHVNDVQDGLYKDAVGPYSPCPKIGPDTTRVVVSHTFVIHGERQTGSVLPSSTSPRSS